MLFDAVCNLISLAYDTRNLLDASFPMSIPAIASFETTKQGHLATPKAETAERDAVGVPFRSPLVVPQR